MFMKHKSLITVLVLLIAVIAIIATTSGIFSNEGSGEYEYMSIRGENISIYGKGIYQHMSSDVAIQGIAQDYVTLFIGVPILLIGLCFARKGSIRGRFVLSGALGYFLLTYLFYTAMAMYNAMFLPYVFLLSMSFFAFILVLSSYNISKVKNSFYNEKIFSITGRFLIINSLMIGILWLGVVVPPLLNGDIYPKEVQHFTTLIVQGFDLSLFLPIGFVSGLLAIKKKHHGYLFSTIYVIFLFILMAALTSKMIFMANTGENVIPVIFIMPTLSLIALILSVLILKSIRIKDVTSQ